MPPPLFFSPRSEFSQGCRTRGGKRGERFEEIGIPLVANTPAGHFIVLRWENRALILKNARNKSTLRCDDGLPYSNNCLIIRQIRLPMVRFSFETTPKNYPLSETELSGELDRILYLVPSRSLTF